MSAWQMAAHALGGIGLFLLGMGMLTEGLRLAAGPALEGMLRMATRTRWHALGSGALLTALVQSSSATTVAVIGFVNAGLLALGPALWLLYGANVGSTMTGWIVALVGLKLDMQLLSLPVIGLGVALRVSGERQRRAAIGSALAGFGLLFLGIGLLQQSFSAASDVLHPPAGSGLGTLLAQLGVGTLLTILMQSSAAAMAVTLTAVQSGLLTPTGAAAVVIGANIGTTVTAVLAAVGATSNARRAAAAHVLFNLITATVALLLLPWYVDAIAAGVDWLGVPAAPAERLALFHTSFNLLGVALMWPLGDRLAAWLQRRFVRREEDEARPRHLDDTLLSVPALAVDAAQREVERVGHMAVRLARAALAGAGDAELAHDLQQMARLGAAAEAFVERMNRAAMHPHSSAKLADVLRQLRYHESVAEQVQVAAGCEVRTPGDAPVALEAGEFGARAGELLALCDPLAEPSDAAALDLAQGHMEAAYERLKAALLAAGASGSLRLADMEELMRRHSALRRAAQQAAKARRRALSRFNGIR